MVFICTVQKSGHRNTFSRVFAVSALVLSASSLSRAGETTCFAKMSSSSVPERMHIESQEIRSMDISGAKLFPLDITGSKGSESVVENEPTTAGKVLSQFTGKYGSIAFVVRRPG